MALKLRSPNFSDRQNIPIRFTFQGESINPALHWEGVPAGTRELAILCEDPDAPTPKPIVHWIVHGIDPRVNEIPTGLPKSARVRDPVLARQGLNSFLFSGYTGPNPGFWDHPHRYVFRLFALSERLGLPARVGRGRFLKAIEGRVLAEASVTGRYQKTPAQRRRAIGFWISVASGLGSAALIYRRRRRSNGRSLREVVLGERPVDWR